MNHVRLKKVSEAEVSHKHSIIVIIIEKSCFLMARHFASLLGGMSKLLYLIYGTDCESFMQSRNVKDSHVY